jgi:hypothetical protein
VTEPNPKTADDGRVGRFVPTPSADAARILSELPIEFDEFELPTVGVVDDSQVHAALSHLYHRYSSPVYREEDAGDGALDDHAALVLMQSDSGRRQFVEHVLFDVRAAVLYQFFVPAIRWILRSNELVDAVVSALRDGSDVQRVNALDIQYYLFGRVSDRPLDEAGSARIAQAVDELRNRDGLSTDVAAALDRYVPPRPTDDRR